MVNQRLGNETKKIFLSSPPIKNETVSTNVEAVFCFALMASLLGNEDKTESEVRLLAQVRS